MEEKIEQAFVNYPKISAGAEKTEILFCKGKADLCAAFPLDSGERRVFVTDETVANLESAKPFFAKFALTQDLKRDSVFKKDGDVLVILGSGEKFKTIENVLFIIRAALESNAPRSCVFIGIGGGVITDMTAFAASIFKRGAKCEFVPTTLLSMVDAAVGGKTGCDFDSYKNMIGSFFPARKLHIFADFTKTLDFSQWRSGFAEVVKTALLYSPSLFEKLEKNPQILHNRDDSLVEESIRICVKSKGSVVERDFTEKNERMFLNLGHTFAHALESCAGLGEVSHGDAVAWGISRAAELSANLGIASREYESRIKSVISSFGWETGKVHSAMKNKSDCAEILFNAMKKDKKNGANGVRFVLQKNIGETLVLEVSEKDVLSVLQ